MRHFIRGSLASLWKDCRGSLFAYTAIAAPVLVGLAGLSVDIGVWYTQARLAQSAADSAALAGALEIIRSKSNTADVEAAAISDADKNGFSTANGDTITVEYPPTSGLMVGSMDSVEVIVTRQSPSLLSSVVYDDGAKVVARAVGRGDVNDTCVWALNPTKQGSVSVAGGAQVSLGCGVFVNSSSGSALTEDGSGCLNSTEVKVVGGSSGDCINPQAQTGIPPVSDPLASLQPPTWSGCDYNGADAQVPNGDATLNPGVYCSRIKITTSGTVTFNPGLYILDGVGFEIGAQATVVGSGLTFYLSANSTAGQPKEINIAAGASVQLSASAPEYPGILFYHDQNAPTATHNFTGGGDMDLVGILYFPNQHVNVSGGSTTDALEALFIADTVSFVGNTTVGGFTNAPIPPNPLLINAVLVE